MTHVSEYVRRHRVASYFVLTLGLTFGSVTIVAGGVPGPNTPDTGLLLAVIAMLVGPPVAGLAMTRLVHGRTGLRTLGARVRKWRVSARWYAVAILTVPATMLASLLVLTAFSREFVPGFLTTDDIVSLALLALAVALPTAFFEELGWSGFATPELRRRHGVLASGLALGAIWGAWHYPVNVWGSASAAQTVPVALFLMVALFSMLPPIRILMVWVYDRTESVLVTMIMHASFLAFWLMATPGEVMTPDAIAGWHVVVWYVLWAALLWAVVAIVVALARRRTGRQAHQGAAPGQLEGRQAVPTRMPRIACPDPAGGRFPSLRSLPRTVANYGIGVSFESHARSPGRSCSGARHVGR